MEIQYKIAARGLARGAKASAKGGKNVAKKIQ
jgi:hypothetical protein